MKNDTQPPQLLSRSLEVVVLESLIGIILTVSAIAGNSLVFVAVYRNLQLRKVSNVYVVCLSFTDFFMGVLVFPIVDATLITGTFPGGQSLCWFQGIISFFLGISSVLTMAMIAVQRYYKVVKPSEQGSIFSTRFLVSSIVLIWSSALVIAVLLSTSGHGVHFSQEFAMCLGIPHRIVAICLYLIGTVFPFCNMSLLYFKIWRFIKSHNAEMSHSNVNAEEVKLTKSLCIVLGAFVVCYTPFVTFGLALVDGILLPRQIFGFALNMIKLASVVNPIIYGVMNREFRAEFAKIICYPWKSRVGASVEPVS